MFFDLSYSSILPGVKFAEKEITEKMLIYKPTQIPIRVGLFSSNLKGNYGTYTVGIYNQSQGYCKRVWLYYEGKSQEIQINDYSKIIYLPKHYTNNSLSHFILPIKILQNRVYRYYKYFLDFRSHIVLDDRSIIQTAEAFSILFTYIQYNFQLFPVHSNEIRVIEKFYDIHKEILSSEDYKHLVGEL